MTSLRAVSSLASITSTPFPAAAAVVRPTAAFLRLDRIRRQFNASASIMSSKIAIIAGVGAGTGGEVAKLFAKHYPVYLLSRNPANTTPLVKEIEAAGGKAFGISADVTSSSSLSSAFAEIKKHSGGGEKTAAAAAIFNASGAWKRAPFLELSEADYDAGLRGSANGSFLFAQNALPLLLNAVEEDNARASTTDSNAYRPPTLIFTGATASVKGSALFAAFSPGKWAVRALSQNLAREFGPKGIHVSHAVIDGVINIPRTKEWNLPEEAKIDPVSVSLRFLR